jgi:hypothetical protein
VVLRGAAADWPAVSQPWGLAWLQQQQHLSGRVRVAPSLQFPFVQPSLLEVLLQLRGESAGLWRIDNRHPQPPLAVT